MEGKILGWQKYLHKTARKEVSARAFKLLFTFAKWIIGNTTC